MGWFAEEVDGFEESAHGGRELSRAGREPSEPENRGGAYSEEDVKVCDLDPRVQCGLGSIGRRRNRYWVSSMVTIAPAVKASRYSLSPVRAVGLPSLVFGLGVGQESRSAGYVAGQRMGFFIGEHPRILKGLTIIVHFEQRVFL